tara:strand:+ start:2365 stop:2466 length:102 start_codon:yes stop_codon:yes gene_type:complete
VVEEWEVEDWVAFLVMEVDVLANQLEFEEEEVG